MCVYVNCSQLGSCFKSVGSRDKLLPPLLSAFSFPEVCATTVAAAAAGFHLNTFRQLTRCRVFQREAVFLSGGWLGAPRKAGNHLLIILIASIAYPRQRASSSWCINSRAGWRHLSSRGNFCWIKLPSIIFWCIIVSVPWLKETQKRNYSAKLGF